MEYCLLFSFLADDTIIRYKNNNKNDYTSILHSNIDKKRKKKKNKHKIE